MRATVRSFVTALSTAIRGGILGKIPGFRQGKLSHKIFAVTIYLSLLTGASDLNLVPDNPAINTVIKILFFIMCLLPLALCIDFAGIRRFFPGTYHRQKSIRYIIIYLYSCVIMSMFVLIIIRLSEAL